MKLTCLLASLFVCLVAANTTYAQGWRGIVPLRSSRSDVERLLGPATGDCNCHYETQTEWVRINYAENPCEGYPAGWNVPRDTVLQLTVQPKIDQQFSALGLDESKFTRTADDAFHFYYASREEGIQYTVANDEVVRSISYIPSARDAHLRCRCYPPEDDSIERGTIYDEFGPISFVDALGRLDNFAIQLLQVPVWKGYVIIYAGRRAYAGEATVYGRRVRDHLVRTRNIPTDKIEIIDGGHRERFTVELFLFPPSLTPPRPLPTIGQCGVQIINRRSSRRRRT